MLQANAASLLRLARAHSLCADDAQDAYQRGVEIYLRKLDEVEEATAGSWLRTVVKHEAMAVRSQRQRYVGSEEVDPDQWASAEADGEERALSFERTTRAAEALQSCKRDEVSAMFLKAGGHSYTEIASLTGWSYTKVNRCLAEGRARFLERYADIESGAECRRIAPLLSAMVDGEATDADMRAARPHLRNCPGCRAGLRELQDGRAHVGAVLPVGALAGGIGAGPGGVWDALSAAVHSACLRMQSLLEGTSVAKASAVAASAAALAGGGAAVVHPPAETHGADRVTRVPPVRAAASDERPAAVTPAERVRARPPGDAPAARPRRRRSRTLREFGFESATVAVPAAGSPRPETPPARHPPRREAFGFER